MFGKLGRSIGLGLLATLLVLAVVGLAAAINPNERTVKPEANAQDSRRHHARPTSKVWVLDFKFKDPRLIKVNVPGRGQKVCWYLWYQVINNTSQPHTFIPDFELVTPIATRSTTIRFCPRCRTPSASSKTRRIISKSRTP